MDTTTTWLVSKVGNDSNTGHPSTYPINLANDSKLTIGAAVASAASGDTILIWPGTYNEAVVTGTKALTFMGTSRNRSLTVITVTGAATDNGALNCQSDTTIANLSLINTGASAHVHAAGLFIDTANVSNINVDNCYIQGPINAMYFLTNISRVQLLNSRFYSQTNAGFLGSSVNPIYVYNCIFETANSASGTTFALITASAGLYLNCQFLLTCTLADSSQVGGVLIPANIRASFVNCNFIINGGTVRTGIVTAVYTTSASSIAILVNCILKTAGTAASALYDIYNYAGTVIVNGCSYNTSSGVITQIGSGYTRWLQQNAPVGIGL